MISFEAYWFPCSQPKPVPNAERNQIVDGNPVWDHNCVFHPGGTTDGVPCSGEVDSYWVDDGEGDMCEVQYCVAHVPPGAVEAD